MTQACSRPLEPQPSCNFVQNSNLQRVSWNRNLPVKFFVHQSVPREAYAAIDRAIDEYNQHFGNGHELIRIVARGSDGDLKPSKDGSSVIYWLEQWDPKRSTEQARTTIYWAGSQIFEADIRINAAHFAYHYGEESTFREVDLTSLLVHEFGHALGLAHTSNSGSVMNTHLGSGQDRRKLSGPDLANLSCEY